VQPDGTPAFEIYTEGPGGERVVHAAGRLHRRAGGDRAAERLEVAALRAECDGPLLDAETCYARFADAGLEYGPTLRAIESLDCGARQAVARLRLSPAASARTGFALHPSMLDAALQSTAGLFATGGTSSAALPFALDGLELLRATPESGWAVARFAPDDRPGAVRRLDVDLCDDDGEVCVRLRGFQVRTSGHSASSDGTSGHSTSDHSASASAGRAGGGTSRQPAEVQGADADAQLLHLIHAIGEGALSADEFQRSLI
jgi:hypothetical protein